MKRKLFIIIPIAILAIALICGGVVFAASYISSIPAGTMVYTNDDGSSVNLTLVSSETLPNGDVYSFYTSADGSSYAFLNGELSSFSGTQSSNGASVYAAGTLTRDRALAIAEAYFADRENFDEFSLYSERENDGEYTFRFRRMIDGFAFPGAYSATVGANGQVNDWSAYGVGESDIINNFDTDLLDDISKDDLLAYCENQLGQDIDHIESYIIDSDGNGGYVIQCGFIYNNETQSGVIVYPLG